MGSVEHALWMDAYRAEFPGGERPEIYPAYDPLPPDSGQRWCAAAVSPRLRRLREAPGMTVQALSKAGGVSSFATTSYELGRRLPRAKQAFQLACALGVKPHALGEYWFGSPCRRWMSSWGYQTH